MGRTAESAWIEIEEKLSTPKVWEWAKDVLGVEAQTQWVVGIAAVLGFLRERPLMAVNDFEEGPEFMLELMWKEVGEVRKAGRDERPAEYADVVVFALLTGALFWQQLSLVQRQKVLAGLSLGANGLARLDGAVGHSPVDELIKVAREKDPKHYPVGWLQLVAGENVEEAKERFGRINTELRAKRLVLVGESD